MSFTPVTILPALLVCVGIALFILGWRMLGLVLVIMPVVLGLLVMLWATVSNRDH